MRIHPPVLLGLGIRLVLVFALIAAAIALPLVTTYRSRCREGRHIEAHWTFALPGHQKRGTHCSKPEQGLHYMGRKIGLAD
jgi:hypothetical protein